MGKRLVPVAIGLWPTAFSVEKRPITNEPYGFTLSITLDVQSFGNMSAYFDKKGNAKLQKIIDHILNGKLKIKGYEY
jgi:hypothetical protein